ncbi:uncharacterized protein CBL_11946 [Carabus blaptoides fortunei]
MGSCMGRCFPKSDSSNSHRSRNLFSDNENEFYSLVEEGDTSNPESNRNQFWSYSRRLPSSSIHGRNDIPLQCLDVRALLTRNGAPTTSSTPVSSLDLEWEHETLPVSIHDPSVSSWAVLPEENLPEFTASETSTTRNLGVQSTTSDWSRVSSADSLEWDPVQSPLHCTPSGSELDTDTQQLLTEIERLTDQALRETGCGWTS